MAGGIYSAKNIKVTFGGIILFGLADDNAIELAYDNEGYTITSGIDGWNTISENSQNLAMCTVRLMNTSPCNSILMGFYNSQRLNPALAVKPFSFIDTLGTDKVFSDEAIIMKPANLSASRDVPIREWKIAVMNPVQTGGGSIAPIV